jgi:hypothetical protein
MGANVQALFGRGILWWGAMAHGANHTPNTPLARYHAAGLVDIRAALQKTPGKTWDRSRLMDYYTRNADALFQIAEHWMLKIEPSY